MLLILGDCQKTKHKMKIKCEACNTVLVDPPLKPRHMDCMDILNNEKEYIKERSIVLQKFFGVYNKEIMHLHKTDQMNYKKYLQLKKSLHEERLKVSESFDKKTLEDFKQWKTK